MAKDEKFREFSASLSRQIGAFDFTTGEEPAQREFEKLSYETYLYFKEEPETYYVTPMQGTEYILKKANLPEELRKKWLNWQAVFNGVLERNPKLELFYMLKDMSETNDFTSWFPDRSMESQILDWVDSNIYEPMPVYDCKKIITPEFYKRLQELRKKCGGWLFPTHVTNQILFVADNDLNYLKWHKDENGRYQMPKYWDFSSFKKTNNLRS